MHRSKAGGKITFGNFFQAIAEEDMIESAMVYAKHCPPVAKRTFLVPDIWMERYTTAELRKYMYEAVKEMSDSVGPIELNAIKREVSETVKKASRPDAYFIAVIMKPIGLDVTREESDVLFGNGYLVIPKKKRLGIIAEMDLYLNILSVKRFPFNGYIRGSSKDTMDSFSARSQDMSKIMYTVYEQTT